MERIHSLKFVMSFIIIGCTLICLVCLFLSWNEIRVKVVDPEQFSHPEEGATLTLDSAEYQVEATGNSTFLIAGWCLISGRPTMPIALHVIVKDLESGAYYQLPTTVEDRPDVTAHFSDGVNYDHSGFKVSLKNTNLHAESYEIFVRYSTGDEDYLIPSYATIVRQEAGMD